MKKYTFVLFLLFSLVAFAQSVNDYPYVIVPTKFEFQKGENDYRLNTLTKFNLEKAGFTAIYSNDNSNINYNEKCNYLTVDVKELGGFLITKLEVSLIDCTGKVVFKSAEGKSKSKDRRESYTEALNEAFLSLKALNYKYNNSKTVSTSSKANASESVSIHAVNQDVIVNPNQLFAQSILNGFQLVDVSPKVILKMLKTSQADCFIVDSDSKNGIVFKKNNEWFFEYYENDKLVSEKLDIKF